MSITTHQQYRCKKCNKLLAIDGQGGLEVKCKRCGTLNFILEKMLEQVIVTDPDGIILYTNDALEQVTGYTSGEVIGKTPALWRNQMPKELYQDMWNQIKVKKQSRKVSLINQKKDGTRYQCELRVSPICDTNNEVRFYIGIEKVINN